MSEAASGDRGQGKFIKLVLKNYFSSESGIDIVDKRTMMAFALRDAKPLSKNYNQLDETEKEKAKERFQAECLTNMLKGAGPLLQKILQGMPAATENNAFSTALKDMKSNLAPIPEELVQEQLYGIVQRSRGNISEIKVERALGAASVGQAFLCKIFGPHLPKEGKKVVVKILRPDVKNRMSREKRVLLKAAEQTDENGGMLATYQGQLKRIEEEMDLSLEADNVELGKVYDKTYKTVKSMKVSNLVDPTANVLVLEQAEGETVDRYMESVTQEHTKIIDDFVKKGGGKIKITPENARQLAETREKLVAMLQQLQKRQEHMRNLAEMWVTEGIYGEGFYHGDLHAGNIIINDEGLTVIDFGNATKLTQDQQSNIIRMMAAAAVGDVKTFRHGFHMLLENTDPKFYASKRAEFTKVLEEIFSLGTKENAGQRIGAALIKAQELGLELPSAISNFSQCQLRLQNAMTSMNDEIEKLQQDIARLDSADTFAGAADPLTLHLLSADAEAKSDVTFRKFLDNTLEEWGDLDEEHFNYMALSKQQQSIEAYEKIQSEMKTAIAGAETIEDGFAQAMIFAGKEEQKAVYDAAIKTGVKIASEWLNKAYYFVDQNNEQEVEEYTSMRTKLDTYIQKPEENLDGIKEEATKLANFFKMKKTALDNLREAQNKPDTSSLEMEKQLREAYKVANAVNLSTNMEESSVSSVFLYAVENLGIKEQMENWTKHNGELGRAVEKAYDEYVQAFENKSADAKVKWMVFKLKYREMLLREVKAMRKAYNVRQRSLSATPDSFYDVMSSVIESNKAVTFKHLGTYNTISYYFKM